MEDGSMQAAGDQIGPVGGAASGGSSHGMYHQTRFSLLDLTPDEQKQLVESVEQFHGSVARIIRVTKKRNRSVDVDIGTASLAFRGKKGSLFVTCDHTFGDKLKKEVIRFSGDDRDYRIEKIEHRDKIRDLLLFWIKNLPERLCVDFSTDKVNRFDKVAIIGHVFPMLVDNSQEKEIALVTKASVFTGRVLTEPYEVMRVNNFEKISRSCAATGGVSGAAVFKDGKVIAVHLGADKEWRDAVSTITLLQVLRGLPGLGDMDNNASIRDFLEMLYKNRYESS